MARPSNYAAEIADAICLRIAGGESLRKICDDDALPDKSTVLRWLCKADHQAFRDQYARARDLQADLLAEEIIDIADDGSHDMKLVEGEDGPAVEVVDREHIQRSKLRVDARKWFASKVAPKRYGERVIAEHSGPDGQPIQTQSVPATKEQIQDDLKRIFGAAAEVVIPAAVMPAAAPAGRDPLVHAGVDGSGGEIARAFAIGETLADEE